MQQNDMSEKTNSYIMKLFLILLIYMTLNLILQSCLAYFTGSNEQTLLSRANEIFTALFSIVFIKFIPTYQHHFGLAVPKEKIKSEILLCCLSAFLVIGCFYLIRLIYGHFNPDVAARPWFGLYLGIHMRYTYLPSALVQEWLAKAVLQHSIEKILPEDKWYIAIIIMMCSFSIIHTPVGLYYQLGSIVVAAITGIIYHYRKNIYVCTIIHFLIGFMPRVVGLK